MLQYDFGLRFRQEQELEGCGSLLVTCTVRDAYIIRRLISEVMHQHPTSLFDGMTYYGSRETPETTR